MDTFFKAYDMRGTFGVDFDLALVRRIGRELPAVLAARNTAAFGGTAADHPRLLVGRDCRNSSAAIRDALVAGLAEGGAAVTDLGPCTTPMIYHFTAEDGFDGSVMITASHNPPSDNGLKVSTRGARPVGFADGLDEVARRVRAGGAASAPAETPSCATVADALPRYVAWQRTHAPLDDAGLRFAIDCSNGMASLFARELFPGAEILNDRPDGNFPAHGPNPLKADSREQVAECVRAHGLDCGIVFDGDADRCVFVDERGAFIPPDLLIPLVARASGTRPGERVIHDVRTSRGAIAAIRDSGFEPAMVPVGHVFAKAALRRLGAACGGELAGHYYFADFHGCDSGVLAARRVLAELARAKARGETLSQLVASIAGRWANSGELNFRVADKSAAIARILDVAAKRLPPETGRSTIDGIRVEFAEGWFSVRPSNTEPFLRLVVECDGPERLADWVALLSPS